MDFIKYNYSLPFDNTAVNTIGNIVRKYITEAIQNISLCNTGFGLRPAIRAAMAVNTNGAL